LANSYSGVISTTENYLDHLYSLGFNRSKYLTDEEVIEVCDKIGVFRLKGYVKEINQLIKKNIDDVLIIYFFDKYFSKVIFDITSRIEAKLKSILVHECYKRTNNHFFYLIKDNHKWSDYKIDFPTINNWKVCTSSMSNSETYSHYILFYLQNYDFSANKNRYLNGRNLININTSQYNYPPFKYLIESATLGSIISFIRSLKIGTTDIYSKTASHFGLGSNGIFKNYLERLNEIRNRVAHGGRIFNRTFRSATGVGKYQLFRTSIQDKHKALDVYLFLFYMLNQLEDYHDMRDFEKYQVKKLFRNFKKDYISNKECFKLIKKYKRKEFKNIQNTIYKKMCR